MRITGASRIGIWVLHVAGSQFRGLIQMIRMGTGERKMHILNIFMGTELENLDSPVQPDSVLDKEQCGTNLFPLFTFHCCDIPMEKT